MRHKLSQNHHAQSIIKTILSFFPRNFYFETLLLPYVIALDNVPGGPTIIFFHTSQSIKASLSFKKKSPIRKLRGHFPSLERPVCPHTHPYPLLDMKCNPDSYKSPVNKLTHFTHCRDIHRLKSHFHGIRFQTSSSHQTSMDY